jgi:cardiolipin synthase
LFWRYIPNILCIIRILCAPSLFLSILSESSLSLPIIFLAALTDFLDGYTARKFKVESKVGAILDPLADKIFCNTALWSIYLLEHRSVSLFLVAILLSARDLALLCGGLLIVSKQFKNKDLKPIFMSKICTAMVFTLCGLAVMDIETKDLILEILSFLCLFGIITSFYLYVIRFTKKSDTTFQ